MNIPKEIYIYISKTEKKNIVILNSNVKIIFNYIIMVVLFCFIARL